MSSPSRRPALALAVAAIALLAPASGAAAAADGSPPPTSALHAVLDGRSIPLSRIPDLHCHDLAYPEIRCFTTAGTRDASLGAQPDGLASVVYVTVFDGPNLTGGSFAITQDYTALQAVNWNDRISSMRVSTSGYGWFYTDWFYGGASYLFCCAGTYGSLGAYNDTFSSVDVPD